MDGILPTSKKIVGGTLLWIAAGLVSVSYIVFAYNPASAILGVEYSAARLAFFYQFVFLVPVPIALYGVYVTSRDERFRAPPGRYVPGQHYNLFSPYNLAAMGIIAALYAATAVFGAVTNFDIVAAVTAFSAAIFPPIVPLVAVIVGGFLRFGLGAITFLPSAAVPAFVFMDAARWAIASWLIFWLVRAGGSGLMSYAKWIAVIPIVIMVHASMTIFQYYQLGPWSNFVGNAAGMAYWYPTSAVSIVVGLIAAEAAYRSLTVRQRSMMEAPPAQQS